MPQVKALANDGSRKRSSIAAFSFRLRGKMTQVKAQVEDGSRKTSPATAWRVRRRGKMHSLCGWWIVRNTSS